MCVWVCVILLFLFFLACARALVPYFTHEIAQLAPLLSVYHRLQFYYLNLNDDANRLESLRAIE